MRKGRASRRAGRYRVWVTSWSASSERSHVLTSRRQPRSASMILAAIFIIFLLQIFARYSSKIAWLMPIEQVSTWMSSVEPIGWTINLISLLWVWLIFFGCAFIVKERDHVTFDILYLAFPDRLRKIAIIIISLIINMKIYNFCESLFPCRRLVMLGRYAWLFARRPANRACHRCRLFPLVSHGNGARG